MAAGKKTGGRQKGTKNKATEGIEARLKELKCDPIEGMANIAQQAMDDGDMPLAGQMYKELAQYIAPKRKAIEMTGANGDDLFPSHIKVEHV
ncbi:MAG: hypothetical protein JKX91_06560 [Rhizobiaceae bacterium]|nr:hypothetical protein [Rhizobiaceae bacterium]